MGGSFDMRLVSGKTKEEIEKKWNDMVDADLHENGHSYSGSIGMLGQGFKMHTDILCVKEAEESISENHNKWEQAIAIQIKTGKNEDMIFAIGGWCSS